MQIEDTHINKIKEAFEKMQSTEDLLLLLNIAKPMVYGEKAVPFELKQITWYSNPKLGGKRYTEFKIKKKSGAARSIHAPVKGLKSLQKTLSFVLQCVFEPHQAAMGFVRDKSIVDNARIHEARNYVHNIDLKDFFTSVDQARVWKCLQLKPFNLTTSLEKLSFETGEKHFWPKRYPVKIEDEERKTIRLNFNGYRFQNGYYILKIGSSLTIEYKVEKYSNKDNNGLVSIIRKKSTLEQIRIAANDIAQKYGVGTDIALVKIFQDLIINHQKEIFQNRSLTPVVNIISSICCTRMEVERLNESGVWIKQIKNVIPQGAPTSPVITNIVCQRLDYLLSAVAKRFGLKYSRYADDITFSSMHNVYQPESDFLKELQRIILEQGFHIKESKTRLQKNGYRKEVTGLLVNEKANVQQRYIKQLRMWLYYWERYGYERAYGFFLQEYIVDKGPIVKGKPNMASVIAGKLDYLKMVKGANNELYLKLKGRFDDLIKKPDQIGNILNVWENNGIENAMVLYYNYNPDKI